MFAACRYLTLDGAAEGHTGIAGAGRARVSLPGLSLGVLCSVLRAGGGDGDGGRGVDGWEGRTDGAALSLGDILQSGPTPHTRTSLCRTWRTARICKQSSRWLVNTLGSYSCRWHCFGRGFGALTKHALYIPLQMRTVEPGVSGTQSSPSAQEEPGRSHLSPEINCAAALSHSTNTERSRAHDAARLSTKLDEK